jgi:hypothetical protein
MEYRKPELILTGLAESLVLGAPMSGNDPEPHTSGHSQTPSSLEFED